MAFCAGLGPARAAENIITTTYDQGAKAYLEGDYKGAVDKFIFVISRAPDQSALEPVYYLLSMSYMNLLQYDKAAKVIESYLTLFPKSDNLDQVNISLAEAYAGQKKYDKADAQYKKLEANPALKDRVVLSQAKLALQAGKGGDAVTNLERLIAGGLSNPTAVEGALLLARISAEKGDSAKALKALGDLSQHLDQVSNVATFNNTTFELGNQFFKAKDYDSALACYRMTRTREQLVQFQKDRIASLKSRRTANGDAVRAGTLTPQAAAQANKDLDAAILTAEGALGTFQNLPAYSAGLLLRMGQCFYRQDRKWESIVFDDAVTRNYPDAPEAESAFFARIVALTELGQSKRAAELCDTYLKKYAGKPNSPVVVYLQAVLAYQGGDLETAEKYFNDGLGGETNAALKEEMAFLLGNVRFDQRKYDKGTDAYNAYLKAYPTGKHAEEAAYRIALGTLLAGNLDDALKQFTDYVKKNPTGTFLPDAKYRLAYCHMAAKQYDQTIADCNAWEKEFANNPLLGEVLALRADTYAYLKKTDLALADYLHIYDVASKDSTRDYGMTAADKILQAEGNWEKVAEIWQRYATDYTESPLVVQAMFNISKARVKQGQVEEAKKFITATIQKNIDDPSSEEIDQLVAMLAQLCAKKPKAPPSAATGAALASTLAGKADAPASAADASAAPAAPAYDPEAELDRQLASVAADANPTAKARLLYAHAEMARLRKQPEAQQKYIQALADQSKPEDLSPVLLGLAGDYCLDHGQADRAAAFYNELKDGFPKSQVCEYAYVGLGRIALAAGNYPAALQDFDVVLDKIGQAKVKDATLGKAQTLFAMGKLDDAQKLFEQVASTRAWRGEVTAQSIFMLGEINAQRNKWPEANAYYQRIYVAYQRYLPIVAKAYLGSGLSFEKMGKNPEAIATYQEMLRNAKLASLPETAEARKRLSALGGQA